MTMGAALQAGDPRQVGRYRIVSRLGAGGMGRVYLGRSPGGRTLAVKVVRSDLAEDDGFRRRFAREVAAARRVNGVFTAAVVDADPEGDPPWLATAYVPGLPLGDAVTAYGPWAEGSVLTLGAGLAEALEAIHAAGVVHRDLKPANVMLSADGPRVIDFGISVATADDTAGAGRLTTTGAILGTPGFMAPEQVTGDPVGPAADVFALGVLLSWTATGASPFGEGSGLVMAFRAVHGEPDLARLPGALRDVVGRCLAKEPERRPGVTELLELLTAAQDDRPDRLAVPELWLPAPVARAVRTTTAVTGPEPTVVDPAPSPAPVPTPVPERVPDVAAGDRAVAGPDTLGEAVRDDRTGSRTPAAPGSAGSTGSAGRAGPRSWPEPCCRRRPSPSRPCSTSTPSGRTGTPGPRRARGPPTGPRPTHRARGPPRRARARGPRRRARGPPRPARRPPRASRHPGPRCPRCR
ncbi:protein kinase [Streptomyces sp. ZAF1911]|uniref:serine/threonine-protein kinase n=1 Tax=Streptomyces sp. ZAF1911 TaxID=2944129 RepID=UPI00237B1AE4|nr:serine/threonine protein kinase [Streptomyces sp. ZAF1911]MDD9377187.1 protein kinase [Streptomyces sp. ZAF1911]